MYNVCKSLHKLGLSIKRFVKMGSITAEQIGRASCRERV